jgi:hypothetical protein
VSYYHPLKLFFLRLSRYKERLQISWRSSPQLRLTHAALAQELCLTQERLQDGISQAGFPTWLIL